MRRRRVALLLAAWCATRLLGCSSSANSTAGGTPYGGQTGSLTPTCGVAPLAQDGAAVASGNSVAVVYTASCTNTAAMTVIGPDGKPVPYSLEPLDQSGTYVVHTTTALSPGSYAVTLPSNSSGGQSTQVTVSDAAPMPTALGTLTADAVGGCNGATFTLTLDPSAIPYAALIRLTGDIDGGPTFIWVPYGALALNGNQSALELRCLGDCQLDGAHTLNVAAKIAGQAAPFDVQAVPFTTVCPAGATPPPNCSFGQPPRAAWPAGIGAALMVLAWSRRRRSPASG